MIYRGFGTNPPPKLQTRMEKMPRENSTSKRKRYIVARIPTDKECDDWSLQLPLQALLYPMSAIVPRRKIIDCLWRAAMQSNTVLLHANGSRANPSKLTYDDCDWMDAWIRDYIRPRPHIQRRNRKETLERRRYLMALARMAWPREMASHKLSLESLGVEFTDQESLKD